MAYHQHRADDIHGAASKQDVTDAEARLLAVIADLCDQLREHGIAVTTPEVVHLATR